jgi:hypothetical protein
VLARHILQASNYEAILVLDPKCTFGGKNGEDGYKLVRKPSDLKRLGRRDKFIQLRPDERHQTSDDWDEAYWWAYRRGNVMVYTDETFLVMNRSYAPDGLRACVTCGRELGVGMIFGTQRPRGIDLRILTEAEVISMFDLRHKDDRKRMAEMMGEEVLRPLPRHAFWHWRTGMEHPVALKLKLS